MAGAVLVGQHAVEDEGDGFEAAVRVRAERQAVVVGRVGLRTVVVEEQERIELFEVRVGQRALGQQVADIVAHCGVQAPDGFVAHAVVLHAGGGKHDNTLSCGAVASRTSGVPRAC